MTPRGDRLTLQATVSRENGDFRRHRPGTRFGFNCSSTRSPGWARVQVMNATLRSRRVLTVVLLVLCAAPSGAGAQDFVCWPIARGETASSLALRLTGNAARAYSDIFQIKDPSRQMFVPKSQYQRLHPDWQACVAR